MVANGRPVLVVFIALELSLMNYLHFHTFVLWSRALSLFSSILSGFSFVSMHLSLSFIILHYPFISMFYISCCTIAVVRALMGTLASQAIGWYKLAESSGWLSPWKMWFD